MKSTVVINGLPISVTDSVVVWLFAAVFTVDLIVVTVSSFWVNVELSDLDTVVLIVVTVMFSDVFDLLMVAFFVVFLLTYVIVLMIVTFLFSTLVIVLLIAVIVLLTLVTISITSCLLSSDATLLVVIPGGLATNGQGLASSQPR